MLKSIEQIEKYFETGCKPVLVHCNDFEFYVCKYNERKSAANKLFREWVGTCLITEFGFNHPKAQIVQIQKHHAPNGSLLIKMQTSIPAFGSFYNRDWKEVDNFLSGLGASQKSKFNKHDYLKLAFFDLWVSNDDRHQGNYNLLYGFENGLYYFIPIDHESIFHTGNQDKENYLLSFEETLLCSPLLSSLFSVNELTNEVFFGNLKQSLYVCTTSCIKKLKSFIDSSPDEWLINKQKEYDALLNFLGSEQWFEECWLGFLTNIQLALNNK